MACYGSRGLRLHYEDVGDGPPVVLLHGFSSFGGIWAPQLADLVHAGYRVLLPDLAGHGLSQPVERATTVDDLAADVLALLDHEGVDRAVVCGVSLGGMVAQRLAIDHAPRLAGLLVVGSAPRFDTPRARAAVESWADLLGGPDGPLRRLDAAWPLLVNARFRESPSGRACYRTWQRVSARLSGASLAHVARGMAGFNAAGGLPAVRLPALVVAGSEDRVMAPGEPRRVAELIPGAVYQEIPGAAHIPNLDSPEPFTELVLGFLSHRF